MFFEASTRTRISFELAAKALGADAINFTAAGSSLSKGESLAQTRLATIAALGADMFVMRHERAGAPHLASRACWPVRSSTPATVAHAHPTQGLLDALTIRRPHGNRIKPALKVVIVGDVRHSRVARSNIRALTSCLGANVVLCGPPQLVPNGLAQAKQADGRGGVTLQPNLQEATEGADVLMALRIQRERMAGPWLASIAGIRRPTTR